MAPRSIHARNRFKREAISQGRDRLPRSSTFKAHHTARSAERPFDLDHDTGRAVNATCAGRAERRQFSKGPSAPSAPSSPTPPPFSFTSSSRCRITFPPHGLKGTIRLPKGLPIYENRVLIVYEWRPEDGKEKRINQRTGQPYGPIWRPTLAEQMQPEYLARHLATMEQWLSTWVPRSYDGVVCLDVEAWHLKGDEFHLGKAYQDDLAWNATSNQNSWPSSSA